jgi:Asp/Glu/hydantoin racemase
MRRLLLLNPNTNEAMTARMRDQAASHLPRNIELATVTGRFGFPVVATRVAYAVASHAALDAYARRESEPDIVLLSCFGDPGLGALREVSAAPVVGLAEASVRAADAHGEPFAIITVGLAWIGMLEEFVAGVGPASSFVGVFAVDGAGFDYVRSPETVLDALDDLARQAVAAGARTLILGGGALAGLKERFRTPARYVDCIEAAARAALAARPANGPTHAMQTATPSGLSPELTALVASLAKPATS